MKATVTLVDPDEQVVCDVDARDRRAFERVGRGDIGSAQTGTLAAQVQSSPEGYVTWLCWHALVRRGGRADLGLTYPTFEGRVVEVVVEATEEQAEALGDPTRPAPWAG